MVPRHKLTLIDYGEQDAEISWGLSMDRQGKRRGQKGESKDRTASLERCLRRTKATIRRKVMAGGLGSSSYADLQGKHNRLSEKVIKPVLSGICTKRPGRPKTTHSIDRRYEAVRQEMLTLLQDLHLAA